MYLLIIHALLGLNLWNCRFAKRAKFKVWKLWFNLALFFKISYCHVFPFLTVISVIEILKKNILWAFEDVGRFIFDIKYFKGKRLKQKRTVRPFAVRLGYVIDTVYIPFVMRSFFYICWNSIIMKKKRFFLNFDRN